MKRMFRTKVGPHGRHVYASEDYLEDWQNAKHLVEYLNYAGATLGSGHEEISLSRTSSHRYTLKCIPYNGHIGQSVEFDYFSDFL